VRGSCVGTGAIGERGIVGLIGGGIGGGTGIGGEGVKSILTIIKNEPLFLRNNDTNEILKKSNLQAIKFAH